jgi:hypothetical protein
MMTDNEFDILDELYFVTSYTNVKSNLNIENSELKNTLLEMISKGWVNYYKEMDGEANPNLKLDTSNLELLFFLASKQGLFAHNSK